MYTKIICPVDFSDTAINAVEYAGKIAQKFSVELFLLNVKPLFTSELIGGGADLLRENAVDAKSRMSTICTETNRMMHISCDSEVVVTSSRLEKIISDVAKEKSIIVMGTNGIDDIYQYFFGTHTFNVLKRVKCPLILVPEHSSYSTITELVYVWSYDENLKIHLEQAMTFAKLFNVPINLLHIIRKDSSVKKEAFKATLNEAIIQLEKEDVSYDFEQIISNDLAEGVDQFMIKKETSLLIMPIEKRIIVENIFKKNSIKKIAAITSYPIVFIHE